jgi:two-component system, response regulator RegA
MLATLADGCHSVGTGLLRPPEAANGTVARAGTSDDLLLIETSKASRAVLQRTLTAQGFRVNSVPNAQQAYTETKLGEFSHAVVSLEARDRNGLDIVRQLRRRLPGIRIVVTTDADSFASVVMALRAGADDYVAKSADPADLIDALLDRTPELPPVPHMPLGLSRVCWEHIMRIHEQCGRNVTATAQCLRMHRRTLQRILGKRAPQLRADTTMSEPTVKGFRRPYAGGPRH